MPVQDCTCRLCRPDQGPAQQADDPLRWTYVGAGLPHWEAQTSRPVTVRFDEYPGSPILLQPGQTVSVSRLYGSEGHTPPRPPRYEIVQEERGFRDLRREPHNLWERWEWRHPRAATAYAEVQQAEADRRREAEVRAAAMTAAKRKGERLLESMLSDEAKKMWKEQQRIPVVGSKGSRFVLDTSTYTGNINVVQGRRFGKWREDFRYCAHPPMFDPDGRSAPVIDAIIAQMVALQTNEDAVQKVAIPYGPSMARGWY